MRTKEQLRAGVRASLKRRRERLKAAGICPDCGAREAAEGKTLCKVCLSARRVREAKHRNGIPNAGKGGRPLGAKNHRPSVTPVKTAPEAADVPSAPLSFASQVAALAAAHDVDPLVHSLRVASQNASVYAEEASKRSLLSRIVDRFCRLVGIR